MIVKNWMNRNLVTIAGDVTASEALKMFNEYKLPFLPVVDDGRLRGILARRDLRQAAGFTIYTRNLMLIAREKREKLAVRDEG